MNVFSVSQIRAADAYTIANEPIPSVDLMERAARSCYHWFNTYISRNKVVAIVCGMGNNGGDGLALARMLKASGYSISLFVVAHSTQGSPDFQTNYERLTAWNISPTPIEPADALANVEADIWVDAILGSGLNAPLRGLLAEITLMLNQKQGLKIAIDIPTGLFADDNGENDSNLIYKADHTLSFQFPKRSFLFPEFGSTAGEFHILDIGLSTEFIDNEQTHEFYITDEWVAKRLPARTKFDHKGTYGHALIIAGSRGKVGAAILAGKAALRSGAGLVSAYLPRCGLNPMQAANPEVMVQLDRGEAVVENIGFDLQPTAIGLGPGLGTDAKTINAVVDFIRQYNKPLVIDADGLNIISKYGDWSIVPEESVLTPHMGELDRMLGARYRGEAVFEPTKAFAATHKLNILLKGAHSALYATDGTVHYNSTGSNGMATAGSGDVLTGIITGLLAQDLSPKNAAIVAMYHHGLAGEMAALHRGERAVIAGDIIDQLDIA
jgi:hydroxyethylthiazole kinase-like uncharacterized protein yjeF